MLAIADFAQNTFLLDLPLETPHGRFEGISFFDLYFRQWSQLLSTVVGLTGILKYKVL
jgi:hypothetical protein